ncbi:pyruvate-flavodoxin oxidoreductase [Mycoplasma sp. CAG:776]|nr:pyruvate-flavodoxin oxidoreductase [Mycoplasma sp. CAG:776]
MKICDGNKACSDIAYYFSEISSIYPITPSSPMASNIDLLSHDKLNLFDSPVKLVEMQSEAGAAGTFHGALISGSLASTFTASQGLLLMIPNMYKIAGEMLPGVIHVAARTIATNALSIFGDHSDIYATRATGFAILASSNVYDAQNLATVAHLSAIEGSIPFLHFFDGFRTSHEISSIKELKESELKKIIPWDKIEEFKNRALNVGAGIQKGMAMNEDIFFQTQEARNPNYNMLPDIVNKYMEKINNIMGTSYKPFTFYGSKEAENIIIAMGSITDTIKLVIDEELKKGKKIGLITVHLYRPFSPKYLLNVLPKTVKNIAVLDRTKEAGANGEPLYLDIVNALKEEKVNIVGGRFGLSSKNTTPADVKSIYTMLEENPKNNFTVGITDDLTFTSLSKEEYKIKLNAKEFLIYGYGSDGCVSASKDILKIMGKNNKYVNGYFSYDSKKSGGVTVSNLRISEEEINAPFYVTNPSLIVVTKDEYFKKYSMIKDIAENGMIIINTNKNEKEINELLSLEDIEIIKNKKVKVITINADEIATKNGIKGKISKIIEMIILNKLEIPNAYELLKESIETSFKTKGENIIKSNISAIEEALVNLKEIKIEELPFKPTEKDLDVFSKINKRLGDELTVSEVASLKDGTFPAGLSRYEKRHVNKVAPKWIKENCTMCGRCSFVCPHAVIRTFVTKDDKGIPFLTNKEYTYQVLVSEADCTECGLCISECPGKNGKKALEFGPVDLELQKEANQYFNDYENPELLNKFTIPGASLCKPRFEFSGACAGCGETPYINLITRLYGDELVIANATGCSSIYGGSVPTTPYTIPWANSLFEDNAEFALGMHLSYQSKRNLIINIMKNELDNVSSEVKDLFVEFLNHSNDFKITMDIKNKLSNLEIPSKLKGLLNYLPARTVLAIGGDGWAYDIGFGGLDHVLSTNENIKVLVLDTEVYSNTGGQASKSSKLGAVAEFADFGKKTAKKDLFRIAMSYPNCYVASISLGANMMHSIKVMKEAMEHNGPAIIIAYSPCIEQGIKTGMSHSIEEERLASEVGYTLLMRYNPNEEKLYMDNKEPNFDKYEEFLDNEVRYNALKIKDQELAKELLSKQIENAKKRYSYYQELSQKNTSQN